MDPHSLVCWFFFFIWLHVVLFCFVCFFHTSLSPVPFAPAVLCEDPRCHVQAAPRAATPHASNGCLAQEEALGASKPTGPIQHQHLIVKAMTC